ncbi:MAG: cbb3-type cytochrome c oxidase N-terminal domain-containing protein [Ferruginibacter sp.]
MRSAIKPNYKVSLTVLASCITMVTIGQPTAGTSHANSSDNYMAVLMGFIALILAFVIYGMGQVLITLGRQLLEKSKEQTKILSAEQNKVLAVVLLIGCSLLSLPGHAQEQATTTPIASTINYGGLGSTGFWILVTVILFEFISITWMMFLIRRLQAELIPEKERVRKFELSKWLTKVNNKFFTKAVSIEREQDILLDHDYDGIKELDNSLPPWWKWGFGITIVIAIVYLLNFHVFGYGKNPTEEYAAEMEKAKEEKEIYEANNANRVDENNIKMPTAAEIVAGKDIFTTTCFPCHGKAGEGGAGPNLTDDYWLHKGSIADVYQSIKHGYPEKGMQAWEKNYSPKEIISIAGFIKTLRGTNPPNAKATQGDLFVEAVSTDSSSTKENAAISSIEPTSQPKKK